MLKIINWLITKCEKKLSKKEKCLFKKEAKNEKLKNGVSLEKASDKTMILTQKLVIEQLKTKIDKAIEYINHITDELTVDFWNDKTDGAFEDLLNILQGSDE